MLKISQNQLVVNDFIDVGDAGIVLIFHITKTANEKLVFFLHIRDLDKMEKLFQAHQKACLGHVVIPATNTFWSIGEGETVIKQF